MKHIINHPGCILLLLWLWLLPRPTDAQTFRFTSHESGKKRTATQIKANDQTGTQLNEVIYVQHDRWPAMLANPSSWGHRLKFKSLHAGVRFFVDHTYKKKILTPYTFRLVYTVYGYNNPADTNIYSTFNDTLTISYDPDSLATYQDYQVKQYGSFSRMKVVLHGLYEITGPTAPPVPVDMDATGNFSRLNFIVEPVILAQPYVKETDAGEVVYGTGADILKMKSETPANKLMPVRWALPNQSFSVPVNAEPAAYELEWTYIDDYKVDPDSGTVTYRPKNQLTYDFAHNSTRVWSDTNYYQIPIVYQHGYVVYRVRLVRPDSVHFRYPVYSNWSLPESGLVSQAGSSNYRALNSSYMADKLNWQYTVSFAEDGKFKHVLSFYDGLLKNRQSITRFNSRPNLLIATGNIYDYEGRPSISVLPTPIPNQSFVYQASLALSAPSGLPYQASDFDNLSLYACPAESTPPAFKNTAKARLYYSPQNPDKSGFQKFVPDAGGYPFVETLYSPGYDKRVDKQGGAGDSLQIGRSHALKNNYVSEDQMNLNRLFGTDIGWSGFYRKTVSKDPNGQLSLNITDYHGKTVASSLIGIPDTNSVKLALIPNPEVPGASTFNEDFIAGTNQQVSGNKIILDKSIFNDADGVNTHVSYHCDFSPYPTLCGKFLAVKVHYDYRIFDECGVIQNRDSGTMAHTGVYAANTVQSDSTSSGFYMNKGQYNIHKELTINLQDVNKAVDSFMETAGCLKTEQEFVKAAVLSKQFPCPAAEDYSGNPCAQRKQEMMQELWPNMDSIYTVRKYGIYTRISGMVAGNNNSIFSVIINANGRIISDIKDSSATRGYYVEGGVLMTGGNAVPFHYRYQDSCMVQLPNSVTFMGRTYTHLSSLPVDTFIMIFNDDIAEALLPMHPEYCALLNCGNDAYGRKLAGIPDAATAEGLGLFTLTQIIHQDPLYAVMQANTASYNGHAFDTLSCTPGGLQSLDTLAIGQAYCGCGNANMMASCLDHIFGESIAGGLLENDFVRKQYFSQIVGLYLANRSRYLFNLSDSSEDCATCSAVRMTLVPPPVFPQYYNPSGSLSTGPGSFLGMAMNIDPSGATSMQHWMQYLNNFDTTNLRGYVDSINVLYNGQNDTLGLGAVNMIKQQIINCSLDTNKINAAGDTLFAMVQAHLVPYGNFTPAQIRYALSVNGISMTDLCNPYIVNYDNIGPGSALNSNPFSCKEASFYTAASSFLNNIPKMALTDTGTQYLVTLTAANAFEAPLIASIGSTAAKVRATYDTANRLYTVYIYKNNMNEAGAVRLYFQDGDSGSCGQTFRLSAGETIALSIDCVNNVPAGYFNGLASGYISLYTFAATVTHTQGGQISTCLLPGWTDKVPMSTTDINSLAAAVPPTQMKALYTRFMDTLGVYQVKGIDHPYYRTMLRNFMNQMLHKSYSAGQYERYIESCALADSMAIPRYNAYANIYFTNPANAETFINGFKNLDSLVGAEPLLYFYSGTETKVAVDLNIIPTQKLLLFKNYLANYNTGISQNKKYVNARFLPVTDEDMGRIFVPVSAGFTPDATAIFGNLPYPFSFGTQTDTYYLAPGSPYTAYRIITVNAPAGSTDATISVNTDRLRRYLFDEGIPALYLNTHQPTVGPEYDREHKKAFLSYAYASQGLPPAKVLDTLQTASLGLLPDFTGNELQYGHPMAPGNLQNLYVLNPDTATNGNTGFSILSYILDQVSNNLSGHLFFHTIHTKSILPYNTLIAYRCSDHVFWYRYFDSGNNLYNVFIPVPAYLDSAQLAGYEFTEASALPGEGNSRAFSVLMHNPALPDLDLNLTGFTDFTIARNEVLHDVLLYPGLTDHPATADTADNCERARLNAAIYEGRTAYQHYIDSIRSFVYNGFMAWVTGGHIHEELWMNHASRQFNYTLYYYDRAGNLSRSVPPAGVAFIGNDSLSLVDHDRDYGGQLQPGHHKSSRYKYNSLNLVFHQKTPDGGATDFYYDAAGRVVFSQNDKQRPSGNMTYTLYDAQGRIAETGQAPIACPWFQQKNQADTPVPACAYLDPNTSLYTPYPPVVYNLKHESREDVWNYVHALARTEVTETVYDAPAIDLGARPGMSAQDNLRQRVAAIRYYDYLPAGSHPDDYTYAMYFSYDVAGNVKTLTRDFPAWKDAGQEFKRVDYDYDLISGKVNLLSYNRGFADQYFQRYAYDADNRLTTVESSADGLIWQRDAGYEYYQHGPLARMTLGQQYVQGVDYAYTIQGWLKAVNGDLLNPGKDMGKDGSAGSEFIEANDAMAFSIDYFKGDYRPIGADSVSFLPATGRSLYNGNIARSTMALLPFDNLNTRYTYDQLNRIMRADYARVSDTGTLSNTANYYSSYAYDPDGNLRKLVRNGYKPGNALLMDSLVYRYTAPPLFNNRLLNVNDYAANNYVNDITQNTNTALSRYMYDPTGNVIKDLVSGQDTIEWNHYNKVTKTRTDTAGDGLIFAYDGAGNRYLKAVTRLSGDTSRYEQEYVVRDAQGNPLAIYKAQTVFKAEKRNTWVRYIFDDMLHAVSIGEAISQMADPVYGQDGHFKNTFLAQAADAGSWAEGQVAAHPVSWYLLRDNAVRVNILGHTGNYGDFYSAMAAYDDGDGAPLAANALDSLFLKEEDGIDKFHSFTDRLLSSDFAPKPLQTQALGKLCAEEDLFRELMGRLGLDYNPEDCEGNVALLQDYIINNGTPELADIWFDLRQDLPAGFFKFFRELTTDQDLMANTAYTGADGGSLLPVLQNALTNWCPPARLGGFMDQWESGTEMMRSTNSLEALLADVYDEGPAAMMQSLVSFKGNDNVIVKALASIPGLSPASLIYAGELHLSWYHSVSLYQQILKYQRIYLASHVIYGSSRLGSKDYLPGQIYSLVDYQQAQPLQDTTLLNARIPWYSGQFNDVIQPGATSVWDHTQNAPFSASERTGEMQYELSNHLGNVQATVSDNPYAAAGEDDSVTAVHPALKAAYDYYPFGMLMPDRYVSDTSEHCLTVSRPQWSWQWVFVNCYDVYEWPWNGFVVVAKGSATKTGDAVSIDLPEPGDGVSFDMAVTPHAAQQLVLSAKRIDMNDGGHVRVLQPDGEGWTVLAEAPVGDGENMVIPFIPDYGNIRIAFWGRLRGLFYTICDQKQAWVAEEQLVTICDEDKDKYRFGYEGQEKDNELKGIGNSLNFTYRMHDTRVGRFFSIDPLFKKYPYYSPYVFSGNRVIDAVELEGLEPASRGNAGVYLGLRVSGMNHKDAQHIVDGMVQAEQRAIEPMVQGTLDATPIDDIYGMVFGKHLLKKEEYNRGEAAAWAAVNFIPFGKIVKTGGEFLFKGFVKTELKWGGKIFKNAGEFGNEVSNLAGNPREKRSLIESVTRDVAKKNGWKKSKSLSGKLGDEVYDAGNNIYMSVDKFHGDFEVFEKSGSKYKHQGSINVDGVKNKGPKPEYDKTL